MICQGPYRYLMRPWLVLAGLVVGCGGSSGMDGTYHDAEGMVTLEINGGKASISEEGAELFSGKVSGNSVILYKVGDATDSMVFTRNGDGTLSSPMGVLAKRE